MAESHSDAARLEQIITEFFAKSLHIILESRTPCVASRDPNGGEPDSSMSSARPRDKWFNLALKECPAAACENLGLWSWSDPESMVIDVILVKGLLESDCADLDEASKESEILKGKIIERWVVKYEVRRTEHKDSGKGKKRSSRSVLSSLYKKSIVLLRSLYTTVRLLPAYNLFRKLSLSDSLCSCFLAHRVSALAEPFDPEEEAMMQLHGFAPLDTSHGKLRLSVLYLSRLSDVASQTSSTTMATKLIPDWVGSPLVEPVKRFASVSGSLGSFPSRKYSLANYDQYRASPPSFSSSRSSTHSDSSALPPPYPLVSASYSGADESARDMEAGVAVDKISFIGMHGHGKKKPPRNSQDESSYAEITCVFDVACNDLICSSSRDSRDASVGALVDTFQKAQPLTRLVMPRTTADDAFKEFQGYILMRNSLADDKLRRRH